jgi:hypothetical protein
MKLEVDSYQFDRIDSTAKLIVFSIKDPPNLQTCMNECSRLDGSRDISSTIKLTNMRRWLDQHCK